MNNNEPVVIGKVKKNKTGKPLVVLILFLFIGSIVLFLPTITDYFKDYNIIDLVKEGKIIDFFINHENYIEKENTTTTVKISETNNLLINSKTILKYNNFTLTNFNITKEKIDFKINTSTNINFDKSKYYLVLKQNNKEIATIKLIGEVKGSIDYTFNFADKLNNIVEVYGEIKIIQETDYPKFTLSSDETGISSLICTKKDDTYEYIFNDNLLSKIKQNYIFNDIGNTNDYYQQYRNYTLIMDKINSNGGTASIVETYTGFTFTTDIDLNIYQEQINYNYYSLNTKSNIINFEMIAKGYDCK
ncbi:MAG: hypothetical protein IJD92_02465 [Bacilli bacterium]|nr:hypothetical protein [Bacilli bacterium]